MRGWLFRLILASFYLGNWLCMDEVYFIQVVEKANLFLQEVPHGGAEDYMSIAK